MSLRCIASKVMHVTAFTLNIPFSHHTTGALKIDIQELLLWMWCLFMASGVVPLPPGDGRVLRMCSPGTSLATWTTSTAGPQPGCRRMCLKLACSLWNTQPLPQAGRSAIPCCIHWLIATNAYQVHQLKRVCRVLPNQCCQKQRCV